MNNKRIISTLLALLVLAGCGTTGLSSEDESKPPAPEHFAEKSPTNMKLAGTATGLIGLGGDGRLLISRVDGSADDDEMFEEYRSWENLIDFDAQGDWVAAIDADGQLYCSSIWYRNQMVSFNASQYTDIADMALADSYIVLLHTDGTVGLAGTGPSTEDGELLKAEFSKVGEWADIVEIEASPRHIVGLKNDGSMVACGLNNYGECSVSHLEDIVYITADNNVTAAVDSEGRCYGAGDASTGSQSFEGWENVKSIALSASERSLGVTGDGKLLITPLPYVEAIDTYHFEDVKSASDIARAYSSYGLMAWVTSDGRVEVRGQLAPQMTAYDWNMATGGSMGNTATPEALSAKRTELDKYRYRLLMGAYYTIGFSGDGTLLVSSERPQAYAEIEDWDDVVQYVCGDGFVFGRTEDGHVRYAGHAFFRDDSPQMPEGWENLIDITVEGDNCIGLAENGDVYYTFEAENRGYPLHIDDAVDIEVTSNGMFAILTDGSVRRYGKNDQGTIEAQDDFMQTLPPVVQVSFTQISDVFLTDDGTVEACVIDGYSHELDHSYLTDWRYVVRLFNTGLQMYGLRFDGSLLVFRSLDDSVYPTIPPEWNDIVAITGNGDREIALKSDGTVLVNADGDPYNSLAGVSDWDLW